jgi:prevent-host-death family protein
VVANLTEEGSTPFFWVQRKEITNVLLELCFYDRIPFKVLLTEHHTMDITQDIQALTTFRNNSATFLQQLKKTKRPVVLTVNGKAAAVIQDAEAYQRLLDIAAQADAEEGIRQGLEDIAKGRVYPAREALRSFRREHGISR